jgi:hypothetical protein
MKTVLELLRQYHPEYYYIELQENFAAADEEDY